MKLKVLTINIWRYYEWEKRKNSAIKFLKEQDADIVFLQEAAYDERLKDKWKNQVQEINDELRYRDFSFSRLTKMTKWHKEPIDWVMYYGLGILSKYLIKHTEMVILPHVKKNKDFGFVHSVLETLEGTIDLINVHFENTDEGSKEHLKKTLEWCKKKKINPIIAGDFNMKITENLIELAGKDYNISYKIKPYISFMPTDFSNNDKPITLDYILAHKNRFKVKEIKCFQNKISDHNPVLALIEFKS